MWRVLDFQAMPLGHKSRRALMLVGLAVLVWAVEFASGSYPSEYKWGYGLVSHMLHSPVRYWTGANWLTLGACSAAAYKVIKSTRP